MGVPFEALLPYGIMLGMFTFSSFAVGSLKEMQNGGKKTRRGLDVWDRQMMQRDRRLTGWARGQTDLPEAPPGFELNNPWRVSARHGMGCGHAQLIQDAVGEALRLDTTHMYNPICPHPHVYDTPYHRPIPAQANQFNIYLVLLDIAREAS
ncbi:unnamed protein product [Periconia digitata]|uniref:NADH dehydrogenase [ubiquinone] 1 alpha subcomplex subunit 1 n=1 Tax=Periconia digitata TaxID=1303443 RepID=A0A9W4XJB6_9PLEO|nr:unnamed protein product [Periconia digitata]